MPVSGDAPTMNKPHASCNVRSSSLMCALVLNEHINEERGTKGAEDKQIQE